MRAYCRYCNRETEFTHVHDTCYGIPNTHIKDSERYECKICENKVYKNDNNPEFIFILD